MDTLLFYFLKSSYSNLFRGVAECYAFPCFHDNVGLWDFPVIRHIKGTDAVIVNIDALVGNIVAAQLADYGHREKEKKRHDDAALDTAVSLKRRLDHSPINSIFQKDNGSLKCNISSCR